MNSRVGYGKKRGARKAANTTFFSFSFSFCVPAPCSTKLHSTCFTDLDEIFLLAKKVSPLYPLDPHSSNHEKVYWSKKEEKDIEIPVSETLHGCSILSRPFGLHSARLSSLYRGIRMAKVRLSPSPMSNGSTSLGMSARLYFLARILPGGMYSLENWPSEKAIL